jgi:hypothetical protein
MADPTFIRWEPQLDRRVRRAHAQFPPVAFPHALTVEPPALLGRFDCSGRYVMPRSFYEAQAERLTSGAWRRTTVACARSSNEAQCRRCLFLRDCAHRLVEPEQPQRTPIPGGAIS